MHVLHRGGGVPRGLDDDGQGRVRRRAEVQLDFGQPEEARHGLQPRLRAPDHRLSSLSFLSIIIVYLKLIYIIALIIKYLQMIYLLRSWGIF